VSTGTAQLLSWAPSTGFASKYGPGMAGQQPTRDHTAVTAAAGPALGADTLGSPWHPDSPLFWIGIIAAATVGLMAFSTTVRVGPAHLEGGLGK
jgi:hypothetical protein